MTSDIQTSARRSTRHIVRIPCEAVRERDFALIGSVILDLSVHGLLLRTSRKVLTGEPMIVSFFEPTTARYFDIEASVARVIHRRRRLDRERAVALEFHSLSGSDRHQLWRLLSQRPFTTAAQS